MCDGFRVSRSLYFTYISSDYVIYLEILSVLAQYLALHTLLEQDQHVIMTACAIVPDGLQSKRVS